MIAAHVPSLPRSKGSLVGRFTQRYCCLLGIVMLAFLITKGRPMNAASTRTQPDLLCNVGDEHECVCNRSKGDLDITSIQCDRFIEAKKISAICIKMKYVDLNGRLYTNESYQQYFRRRLAQLISAHCDRAPLECGQETLSTARYGALTDSNNGSRPTANRYLLESDEDEPSFTEENVVLLKVVFFERNRTEACFVVAKSHNMASLNDVVVVDPVVVKAILESQLAPLSRILGGIRVEGLRIADIKKRRPPTDNTVLVTLMCVVGTGMVVCYAIALAKIIIDRRERRALRKSPGSVKVKSTRSYGTCTEKFMSSNYEITPNGKPKSKSITSIISGLSTRKKKSLVPAQQFGVTAAADKETIELGNADLACFTNYENIFTCDPSQLPEERLTWNSSIDSSHLETENGAPPNGPLEDFDRRPPLPNMVLLGSLITDSRDGTPTEMPASKNVEQQQENWHHKTQPLLGIHPEYERPLSRRGSRDSIPEKGGEECFEEDDEGGTPAPIGDESPAKRRQCQHGSCVYQSDKPRHTFRYSSDSDVSEETVRGYHPFDERDAESTEGFATKTKVAIVTTLMIRNHMDPKEAKSSSDSEHDEVSAMERHHYEKLVQDSPVESPIEKLSNSTFN